MKLPKGNLETPPTAPRGRWRHGELAFTLMEVMIAIAIFFMVSFVILDLVSSGLRTARLLRQRRPDCGMLAAQVMLTNVLKEGLESGDFGRMYPDYNWTMETYEREDFSNSMWEVDFAIYQEGNRSKPASSMSIFVFSPNSQTRRLGLQP